MSDRIVLHKMVFQGRHGVLEREQRESQPFHVDVELLLNLQPAGVDDDLTRSVDYGQVFDVTRQIVESTSFRLLEALAEAIAHEILADFPVNEVGVRVRKPNVPIDGTLDWAGVEIWRRRSGPDRRNG
ncbi:MAG TPA: dihydroneopterin aldolase [Candidatus Saccharimonadales bacterium]|nr:dihydroneopterin aldolase [Candidatus Saccharimonadales bacterium]